MRYRAYPDHMRQRTHCPPLLRCERSMESNPMTESVQQQILAIVAKHADVDVATLKPESTLKEVGIDSLEAIEIIFDIEEHFDITLPDRDPNFDSETAQGLISAVETALAAKGDAAASAARESDATGS